VMVESSVFRFVVLGFDLLKSATSCASAARCTR
jgi:hypothetical protein